MSDIDAIVTQFNICNRSIHRNLEGVSHDESMRRPEPGGNSVNWVLGHLVSSRSRLLSRFGEQAVLDEASTTSYARGSDGNVEHGVALEELLAALDRSQPLLVERLRRFTDEELTAKAPFSSPAGPDATLGQALAAMAFHEAYHAGQLGILRRFTGKAGAI